MHMLRVFYLPKGLVLSAILAACAQAAPVRQAAAPAPRMTPQVRAWTQRLEHFGWDIRYPYRTPAERYVLAQVLTFQPAPGAVAEIRDGDSPAAIAALVAAHIDRNLVPYAEDVRRMILEFKKSNDVEGYASIAPEILGLVELNQASENIFLPLDLYGFFKEEAERIKKVSYRKSADGAKAPDILKAIDRMPQARHLASRITALPRFDVPLERAIIILESAGDAIVLTEKGSRFARKSPRPLLGRESTARYNGSMKSAAWYERWVAPYFDLSIRSSSLEASPEAAEKRLDELIAADPWGEPRSWNSVQGNNRTDVVLLQRRILPPSPASRERRIAKDLDEFDQVSVPVSGALLGAAFGVAAGLVVTPTAGLAIAALGVLIAFVAGMNHSILTGAIGLAIGVAGLAGAIAEPALQSSGAAPLYWAAGVAGLLGSAGLLRVLVRAR